MAYPRSALVFETLKFVKFTLYVARSGLIGGAIWIVAGIVIAAAIGRAEPFQHVSYALGAQRNTFVVRGFVLPGRILEMSYRVWCHPRWWVVV